MYQRIKQLCLKNGITITKLSQDLGILQQVMVRWDTNIPSVSKVQKVADYFGVSIDYLCGRTDEEECKESIIEKAFERPELRTLFSMCENAPAEDIEYVIKKLEKLRG